MGYFLQFFVAFLIIQSSHIAFSQHTIPSIATEESNLYIYIEGEKGNFPHLGFHNAFHFSLAINSVDTISIVSEKDSIAFIVAPKASMIFDVVRQHGKDTLHCVFSIVEKQEKASFSEAYIQAHQGKTTVEIPQVYELVNVIYALTPTAKINHDIVNKNIPYYEEVQTNINKHSKEPIINIFDSLLKADYYHEIKMDAYAFEFIEGGKIKKSDIYSIISWDNTNTLAPYILLLEDFANKSDFLTFYDKQQPLYKAQIKAYQDTIDTHEMKVWLEQNFPGTHYNSFKVIFSPLVNGNQSSCNFDNNGFKELQAHVNYPYENSWLKKYPSDVADLVRGNIVFTELNHGYINPESEKDLYISDINKAFKDIYEWIEKEKPAINYASPNACFNEYMNWALVSLRYVDYAQEEYKSDLIDGIEKMMLNNRGFKKFPEFNQFLAALYQNRKKNEVLADLYPQIMTWLISN